MKKSIVALCILFFSCVLISCKKEKGSGEEKVDQIISQKWISELSKMGMDIYDGGAPPDLEGTITLTPNLLSKSNVQGDPPANTPFVNYSIKLYDQTGSNDIKILSTGYGGATTEKEESEFAAVTGKGNGFSVYGRTTVTVGSNSVVVAIVYSGTIEGNQVKNLKRAFVVVDDSKSGGVLLKNGSIRIFYDGNKTSDFIK